jgi:hypothetical protein
MREYGREILKGPVDWVKLFGICWIEENGEGKRWKKCSIILSRDYICDVGIVIK